MSGHAWGAVLIFLVTVCAALRITQYQRQYGKMDIRPWHTETPESKGAAWFLSLDHTPPYDKE